MPVAPYGDQRSRKHPLDTVAVAAECGRRLLVASPGDGLEPWEQRFRTPVSYLPEWSPVAPDRVVYASNESGQLAGPHAGRRPRRDAAGHGRPGRPDRRRSDARRRRRPLVPGRDGRRVGPVARSAVPRRRHASVPRGRPARMERADSPRRRESSSRRSRIETASPSTSRSTAHRRGSSMRSVGMDRPRRSARRRWLPARRAVGGRGAALPRARRARRPHPPRAACRRSAHRVERSATSSTRGCRSTRSAGRRSPATRGSRSARARGRRAPGDLEPRDRRAHEPRGRPGGSGLRRRLVARRLGAPAREHCSRVAATSTATSSRPVRSPRSRRSRATSGRRASGPTAASGSSTSRGIGSDSSSTTRAPRSSRSARPHPRRARTSPGTSRTSTASSVHGFVVTPDDSGGPFPVMMFVHGGPTLARPRPLAAGGAGVRRPRVRRRARELPRLDRLSDASGATR